MLVFDVNTNKYINRSLLYTVKLRCGAPYLENLCIPLLIKTKAVPFSAILIRWAHCFSLKCGSASRFDGIRPLLILFMAATVYDGGMGLARENASAIVGIFAGSMYLAALPGGWLANNWLGATTRRLVRLYPDRLGHLSIALSAWLGNDLFFIGLMFIVLGFGLVEKPVSR